MEKNYSILKNNKNMTQNLRRSATAIALTVLGLCSLTAANVTGTVTDSIGEPMIEATIRLLSAKDSAFVKGGTTNLNGKFTLQGVKQGSYIVQSDMIMRMPMSRSARVMPTSK